MMDKWDRRKLFAILLACFLLVLPVAVNFLAQSSSPSPTPLADPSPTASASPTVTPIRTPSPTPLPGAQNFHQWGSVTVFNGLPSDSVRAIAQTPDGVMWFGTDNGLARFDGRRVQKFSPGGPDSDRILVLRTASTGELWIGTESGAFVYSDGGFAPVGGTENIGITAIFLGTEAFLGTNAGSVFTVKPDENGNRIASSVFAQPVVDSEGDPLRITSLIEHDGKLLFGTPGRGIFSVSNAAVTEYVTAPRPLFTNSLARDVVGALWIGSDAAKGASGIYLADGGVRTTKIAVPTANVTALEANDAGVWAGSERSGLFHIANAKLKKTYTFENTSGGLRSDTIYALFTDREGVVWIGTNRGVSRFDRLGPMQQTVSDSSNGNFIRTLYKASDGRIYAGSNRGLFAKRDDKWEPIADYGNRPIFAVSEDRSKRLVVGTTETGNQNKSASEVQTLSFADFRNEKFAAVFRSGLEKIESGGRTLIKQDASITTLCPSNEKLWLGTEGSGLYSFDGKDTKLEVGPDVLKSGTIWKIVESPDEGLWIAGQHGVFGITHGDAEKVVEVEDVRDIFAEGENLWAATTTRGLLHARRDERFGWLISAVGFEQGLPSDKTFSILPVEEGLLIATNRGVVTYKPGTVAPKLIATRVISQRVHDLAETRASIDLDYPQNSLLVEVAGQSSRTFPEEFQYGFILKNANGEVLDKRISREPQFAPADLKAGNYAIEVTAFDRDLLASEPLTISFSVAKAPFPWTSTALGVLLAVALIALIWAIIERRRIVIRNRELANARLELANEAERERSRIARDLHDQTLADLRGLIMKSDKELPPDAGFREEIESISTEVRRICEDLSPSVLENVGLIASLEFLLGHTVENYRFDAGNATNEDIGLPMNVQLQIYRIAQEVLANIKQHAGAKLVEMTVAVADANSFEMLVENDGSKFVPPDQNTLGGRGIAGIQARAALIHANVSWSEGQDHSQRFSLTVVNGE